MAFLLWLGMQFWNYLDEGYEIQLICDFYASWNLLKEAWAYRNVEHPSFKRSSANETESPSIPANISQSTGEWLI